MEWLFTFLIVAVVVVVYVAIQKNSPANRQARAVNEALSRVAAAWERAPADQRNHILLEAGIDSMSLRNSVIVKPWAQLSSQLRTAITFQSSLVEQLVDGFSTNDQNIAQHTDHGAQETDNIMQTPIAPINTLDELAGEVGKRIAEEFSAKRFAELFRNKTLTANWTHNDALAIWYCLGYLCLLLSVNSAEVQESTGSVLLDSGLKGLLEVWEMPGSTYQRFASFNRAKLMPALSLYSSISNANEFRQFFGLFASEILGQDVTFSPGSLTVLAQLLQGNRPNYDISLHQTICSMFVATQNEVYDYIRKEAKAIQGKLDGAETENGQPIPVDRIPSRAAKPSSSAAPVEQYQPAAIESLIAEAELGSAVAQYDLGRRYFDGRGVTEDHVQAVVWFRKAAEQGSADALYKLAVCYRLARGVPKDYTEAAVWTRRAAKQGHAEAQFDLGYLYRFGLQVPEDHTEAAGWFRKAAEQGHAEAQYRLGSAYENGKGVPKDFAQAAAWYSKAAEQGDVNAQYNLGGLYRLGAGVPQSYAEAYFWLCLAAEGNKVRVEIATHRDQVAVELTPTEISQVQKRAAGWFATRIDKRPSHTQALGKEAQENQEGHFPCEAPVPLLTVPDQDRMKKLWEAWEKDPEGGIGAVWEEEDPINPPKTGTPPQAN